MNKMNGNYLNCQTSQHKITCCPNTTFIFPVTENDVKCVTKNLKSKVSAGSDEIPEVKQCINHITKLLTHIYNTSYKTSIFTDRLEIDEVKPLYRKGEYSRCTELGTNINFTSSLKITCIRV